MSLIPYAVGASAYGARVAINKWKRRQTAKAVKAVVRRVKQEAKAPKTISSLERKIGLSRTPMPVQVTGVKRRRFADGSEGTRSMSAAASGGYQQHTTCYKQTGRKTNVAAVANRLQKLNIDTAVMQFQKVPQFSGNYGAFSLSHALVTSTQKRYLPIYLVDLTHLAGAGQGCMHRAFMWTAGGGDGKVAWETQSGFGPAGIASTVPHIKYSSQNFSTGEHHDKIHYGRMLTKLNLYGQTNRPTKITVSLVQFTGDDYTPVSDDGLSTNTTGATLIGNAFWQTRVKRLVGNPIADQHSIRRGNMKVLRTATYNIGPTTSIQSDPDPHCITLNWAHYHNRVVNLRKFQPTALDDVAAVDTTQVVQDSLSSQGTANYTPFAKDRVYLMIESTAWAELAEGTSVNAANSASFDMNVQTTIRCDE